MKKGLLVLVLLMSEGAAGFSEETRKIQDNSFLLEEAYIQEPVVIQHIQTFQYKEKRLTR